MELFSADDFSKLSKQPLQNTCPSLSYYGSFKIPKKNKSFIKLMTK